MILLQYDYNYYANTIIPLFNMVSEESGLFLLFDKQITFTYLAVFDHL